MAEIFVAKKYLEVLILITEAYSEPCQTSKMDSYTKMANDYKLLAIFTNTPLAGFQICLCIIKYLIICIIVKSAVTERF